MKCATKRAGEAVESAFGEGIEVGESRRRDIVSTAESFHTSWDKVCDAVEYVVHWGLEHRTLESIRAIGVDEIQYAKGHKYLTLVYQIDQGITRLLWVGKERTIESFQGFFTVIGDQLASQIQFVCSDMWQPYLDVIRQKCSQALHILDRFHIVAKMWQQAEAPDTMTWEEALQYSKNLALAGHHDWRLPTIKELQSLNDSSAVGPSLDRVAFPQASPSEFWSATTMVNRADRAWTVDFRFGIVSYKDKTQKLRVRVVRDEK
jgi:hypothetical protein